MNSFNKVGRNIVSGDSMVSISELRYLPRWIVLFIDIMILLVSFFLAYYVFTKLGLRTFTTLHQYQKFTYIISVNILYMYIFKTYAGIIRHSTFIDLFKILLANLCTFITIGIINTFVSIFFGVKLLHTPVLIVYFTISSLLLFTFRLFVKEFFHFVREYGRSSLRKNILVLGINEQAVAVARAIIDNPNLPYHVAGFITQRSDSAKAQLLGKPIYSKNKLETGDRKDLGIDGVLMIRDMMSKEEVNAWVNLFLEKNLKILKAPSVQKLRSKDLEHSIKNLQIEDLLNRKPIVIENEEVRARHTDKSVLVTGGAGSIGSEIVRQVAQFNPSLVVVLDQAETPLYEIENEVRADFPHVNFKFVMMDVAHNERLEALFQKHQFSMVYHAAAYKHVPLVEENPQDAVLTNVLGTKNIACLASQYKVNRFVMVSTDKAVNPTNVMGATKRAAELFVQSLQDLPGNTTKFITTRFGNVLGSNGSVIPLFKKQIENGGPVTITHPEIVRFFMTIPEACELVLQAGTMGKGGEVFVFDMGEPVKILDLARRMIKLSGFEPDFDIKITFTGLRPGEKLYEELLTDDAKTLPTTHEKILISKDRSMAYENICSLVDDLVAQSYGSDKMEVVRILKRIVPEYRSNNSVYEMLD